MVKREQTNKAIDCVTKEVCKRCVDGRLDHLTMTIGIGEHRKYISLAYEYLIENGIITCHTDLTYSINTAKITSDFITGCHYDDFFIECLKFEQNPESSKLKFDYIPVKTFSFGDWQVTIDDAQNGEEFRPMNRYFDFKGDENFWVSNYGRCYNSQTGRYVNDYLGKTGEYYLWYFGENYSKPAHVVVATMFCERPNIRKRIVVDHIDGDKLNNCADNLRWVTFKENSNAQDVQKRKGESLKKTNEYKALLVANNNVILDLQKQLQNERMTVLQQQDEINKLRDEKQQLLSAVGYFEFE